jgi:hypothetical protein
MGTFTGLGSMRVWSLLLLFEWSDKWNNTQIKTQSGDYFYSTQQQSNKAERMHQQTSEFEETKPLL